MNNGFLHVMYVFGNGFESGWEGVIELKGKIAGCLIRAASR